MSIRPHRLSPSTHTIEMAQIADLNARLTQVSGPTAAQLGLEGTQARSGPRGPLPGTAVLTGVGWAGAPAFPDVHAVFRCPGSSGRSVVDLHTDGLRALSLALGLRQTWGVGPARSQS